jgi:hypothetical protein
MNWTAISLVAYYAAATFVAYLPDPKVDDARWWYPPLWHTLQFLAANASKSQTVLSRKPPST